MDIQQTKHFVKISCHKYITKLAQSYPWLADTTLKQPCLAGPLPFPSDATCLSKLIHQQADATTADEQLAFKMKMGIKYRNAMGEIMFSMVKCHPDISPHVTILNQFINHPSEIHYNTLKDVFQYLVHTSDAGIHYWREHPHPTLPNTPLPTTHNPQPTLTTTHSPTPVEQTVLSSVGLLTLTG